MDPLKSTPIIDLKRYRQSRRHVYFGKAELSQIMGLYSRRVSSGEWRDYAIDHLDGMAVFSVFRSTQDQPLFSIAKMAGRPGKDADYLAATGGNSFARSTSLAEVLEKIEKRFRKKLRVVSG